MSRHVKPIALAAGAALLFATPLGAAEARKYLPRDSEVVVGLDLHALLEAEGFKKKANAPKQLQALVNGFLQTKGQIHSQLEAAGIDLLRDVSRLTMAWPGDGDADKFFLIAEGKFNPNRFHAAAEKAARDPRQGVKITKVGAHKVCELPLPAEGKTVHAVLLDAGTLLASTRRETLAQVLETADQKKTPEWKQEVKALLAETDAKQQVRLAGTRSALANLAKDAGLPLAEFIGPFLEGTEGLSGGITIGSEAVLLLRFHTKDAKIAKEYALQMTLALALARGEVARRAKDDASFSPLAEFFKSVRITAEDKQVVCRGQMSCDSLLKLLVRIANKR